MDRTAEKKEIKKCIRPGDIIIAAVIVLLSCLITAFFARFARTEADCAVISRNGTELYRVSLYGDKREYIIEGDYTNHIIVGDGEAYFSESDCRDHVCMDSGRLCYNGQTAACLPNRVAVRIVKSDPDQPDLVVG